jgi:hypothetical protein
VLWEMTFAKGFQGRAPTVALFEHRGTSPTAVDLDDAIAARTLAILHVQSDGLDTGAWRVLGRRPVVDDPHSGPCTSRDGLRRSWDGLAILANAWYGLTVSPDSASTGATPPPTSTAPSKTTPMELSPLVAPPDVASVNPVIASVDPLIAPVSPGRLASGRVPPTTRPPQAAATATTRALRARPTLAV